ncbi:MAG: transketolase [Flammeovirgaceae bacterium]|nr:transketolase [Flammeovirgaceae bacterium]|tara:strand:- start:3559 stop:4371 length:813 start_codon:yes stop_codon:yes gene_type:complete
MNLSVSQIKLKITAHRKTILKTINKIGKGHIGGAFSCMDLLASLYYGNILNIDPRNFGSAKRNRVILSKGHACIAQYVILEDMGFFGKEEFDKMNNGGILGEHPDPNIPGIEFISGSLGHGLGVGVGMALANKMDDLDFSIYIVLGDGECYEGTIWEAASLGAHLKLTNLVVVIDRNRLCIHGNTEEINALEPMGKKWEAFGWNVKEIDGHNIVETISALKKRHTSKPTVLIANTVKGKGVSFMENQHNWHHGAITNQILEKALNELNNV